jgi:hypothetical protein
MPKNCEVFWTRGPFAGVIGVTNVDLEEKLPPVLLADSFRPRQKEWQPISENLV